MKDFEELKSIWLDQAEQVKLSYEDILKEVRKSKRGFANKLLLETFGMFLVINMIIYIWLRTSFIMLTTHLSMFILIICCFYFIFVQFRDYISISSSELLLKKPEEYIAYLKSYRRNRYILNTRNYGIYSFFIGISFALYFIEIYFIAKLWETILGIIITIAWFIVCYFFMRIYIRKEESRLDEMIRNLERLQKQFYEEVSAD